MEDLLMQLGVGGIFALMVIDRVLRHQKSMKAKLEPQSHRPDVNRKIHELHEWHDHDEHGAGSVPGEKVWWNSSLRRDIGTLADSVENLSENVATQTVALEALKAAVDGLDFHCKMHP